MKKNNKLTGYDYIDDIVLEIKEKLPQEDQTEFDRLCRDIYRAGITEGLIRHKKTLEMTH